MKSEQKSSVSEMLETEPRMFSVLAGKKKQFTLIELLVLCAIRIM